MYYFILYVIYNLKLNHNKIKLIIDKLFFSLFFQKLLKSTKSHLTRPTSHHQLDNSSSDNRSTHSSIDLKSNDQQHTLTLLGNNGSLNGQLVNNTSSSNLQYPNSNSNHNLDTNSETGWFSNS